jgi:hypothetical protein
MAFKFDTLVFFEIEDIQTEFFARLTNDLSNQTDEIVNNMNTTFISKLGIVSSLSTLISNQTYTNWRSTIDALCLFLSENGFADESIKAQNPMPVCFFFPLFFVWFQNYCFDCHLFW